MLSASYVITVVQRCTPPPCAWLTARPPPPPPSASCIGINTLCFIPVRQRCASTVRMADRPPTHPPKTVDPAALELRDMVLGAGERLRVRGFTLSGARPGERAGGSGGSAEPPGPRLTPPHASLYGAHGVL
jgi:hypothetical protein